MTLEDGESKEKEEGGGRRDDVELTLQALCRGVYSSAIRLLLRLASGLSDTSTDCIILLCCRRECSANNIDRHCRVYLDSTLH